jgi:hypothetical protein
MIPVGGFKMTLSLFWSRYILELHEQHVRPIDELYMYLIAREKWNWFLSKIPESEQVQILRGHNHGTDVWTCREWLNHMLEWIKENKPHNIYESVVDKIHIIEDKPIKELEKSAVRTISEEELEKLKQVGYFHGISHMRTLEHK